PVPIAIQRLDDQRFLDVNDSFLILTGYRREEIVTGAPAAIKLWKTEERLDELLRLIGQHGPVRAFESKFFTRSGVTRDVIIFVDIFDVGGVLCTLLIAEDISERIALEEQLR